MFALRRKSALNLLALGFASLGLAAGAGLTGCVPAASDSASASSEPAPQPSNVAQRLLPPAPQDPHSILAQLQRYRGQTSFLNPLDTWWADQPQQEEGEEGEREIEEADLFKVGKPGSKLLYLLNSYRGLQVVSFQDGPEKPKLLGRVKASGLDPQDMYYDEAQNRLIVLEQLWRTSAIADDSRNSSGSNGSGGAANRSRLLIYDVADPSQPRVSQVLELEGSIGDSRLVGDVLYVATGSRDSGGEGEMVQDLVSLNAASDESPSNRGARGLVYSFNIRGEKVKQVDTLQLALPVSYRKNMNIVEVKTGARANYYLLAALSESGWGWWDRSSQVEVVDVSDPKGKIRSIMSVSAKGFIQERSQTQVKNNTLIVASNYFTEKDGEIGRIAVETFRFPTAEAEVLSEAEADYRRRHIERALNGKTGEEYDRLFEELVNDPETGIRGRFVNHDGKLRKLMPDSAVTTGDSTGLSASLQDVRLADSLLYAFWVPSNLVDPFDLFDVSTPERGISYLGRLQFEGWVERAIPMSFGGRNFVIGLGWIVPPTNEERRRKPQAVLFEVLREQGGVRAVELARHTFEGSNIWARFNEEDKFIEVRQTGEGTGEILFQVDKYDRDQWSNGGQVLAYDLKALTDGQPTAALREGRFLNAGDSYLKRIFSNSEINRVNSFADEQLGTYAAGELSQPGELSPVHVLELARNMRAYAALKGKAGERGVQIISTSSWQESGRTTLRLVQQQAADAEKSDVASELVLEGSYLDHLELDQGAALLVMSRKTERINDDNESWNYRSSVMVSKVVIDAATGALKAVGQTHWEHNQNEHQRSLSLASLSPRQGLLGGSINIAMDEPGGWWPGHSEEAQRLVRLSDGTLLAQSDGVLKRLETGSGLSHADLALQNCSAETMETKEVMVLSGRSYLFARDTTDEDPNFHELSYSRNFIAPLLIQGNQATCGRLTNIPGRPLMITASGQILTDDTWVLDLKSSGESQENGDGSVDEPTPTRAAATNATTQHEYRYVTRESLISLAPDTSGVKLVDEDRNTSSSTFHAILDSELVHYSSPSDGSNAGENLEFIAMDADSHITRQAFTLELGIKDAALASIARDPREPGSYYGLMRSTFEAQVIHWSTRDKRPRIQSIRQFDEKARPGPAKHKVVLSQYWYSGYEDNGRMRFTPALRTFDLAQGMEGLVQIQLVE